MKRRTGSKTGRIGSESDERDVCSFTWKGCRKSADCRGYSRFTCCAELLSFWSQMLSRVFYACFKIFLCTLLIQLVVHFFHLVTYVYMGCSDVSEFEHIYGQISTTPSCLYDPLFT